MNLVYRKSFDRLSQNFSQSAVTQASLRLTDIDRVYVPVSMFIDRELIERHTVKYCTCTMIYSAQIEENQESTHLSKKYISVSQTTLSS